MRRSSFIPDETYSPLIVNPDRVLPLPISLEGLKAIAGGNTEIANDASLVQQAKLSQCNVLDVGREFSAPAPGPDQFGLGIGEALNHDSV
jgi:hypothetical protein